MCTVINISPIAIDPVPDRIFLPMLEKPESDNLMITGGRCNVEDDAFNDWLTNISHFALDITATANLLVRRPHVPIADLNEFGKAHPRKSLMLMEMLSQLLYPDSELAVTFNFSPQELITCNLKSKMQICAPQLETKLGDIDIFDFDPRFQIGEAA